MNKKRKAQISHAKRRARERFDVDVNDEQLRQLVLGIQSNKFECVSKPTNRLSVFKIILNGDWAKVVYDKTRKSIVTFMPMEFSI